MRNVGGVRGGVWGVGSAPSPAKNKLCYMYYTAYHVSHVNAHPKSLGRLKKLFFSVQMFFWVCAYLPTGVAVYRMVLDLFVR